MNKLNCPKEQSRSLTIEPTPFAGNADVLARAARRDDVDVWRAVDVIDVAELNSCGKMFFRDGATIFVNFTTPDRRDTCAGCGKLPTAETVKQTAKRQLLKMAHRQDQSACRQSRPVDWAN